MGARVDRMSEPAGTSVVPQLRYPASVMLRLVATIVAQFRSPKSSGVTQGISPSQYAGSPLAGVEPFTTRKARFSRFTSQSAGISPSHSTPESLYAGYGLNRRSP